MSRRIAIVATGGTISSQGAIGAATPTSKAADLLSGIEPLPADIEVTEVIDASHVISPALSLEDIRGIVARTSALAASGTVDGIAITHGTATLIDTAFLHYLTWTSPVGLAVTGAMATGSRISRDGPRNLRDAILAAADPAVAQVGPAVVADGLIHSPRYVAKTHKSSFGAFTSGQYGTIGLVDDDLVVRSAIVGNKLGLPLGEVRDQDVTIVKAYAGMDDRFLKASVEGGAKGIVIETFTGRGGVPPRLQGTLEELLEAGTNIVLCGETDGRLKHSYLGPAHSAYYLDRGAICGADLRPNRCRILLSLLIANGASTDDIHGVFATIAP